MATSPPTRRSGLLNFLVEQPVSIASLAAFRVSFGMLMAVAMIRFVAKGWVREIYIDPIFHFTYPFFGWVRPSPGLLMYAHFFLLILFALGVALGFYYRICITAFFVGFVYIELIDQTTYLNHYYLASLLAGLLIFLPANRAWSLDAWRKPQIRGEIVPAWTINILRFQLAVVYLFAGLAKLNADWLFEAQPLRIWLAARTDLPFIGPLLGHVWVAYCASWFGAVFDLLIVFFLLHRRTQRGAFAVLIVFHIATFLLFRIGMFPWIMILSAPLFFPPDWPGKLLSRLSKLRFSISTSFSGAEVACPRPIGLLAIPLGIYVIIQLALPLRSFFASQPPAWTGQAFNCAWRVMIAEKTGYADFHAFDPASGQRRKLPLSDYLTPRQQIMMAQDPYLIRDLARHFGASLDAQGFTNLQVRVDAFATLNGRPSQRIIDPEKDLAGQSIYSWIIPVAPVPR